MESQKKTWSVNRGGLNRSDGICVIFSRIDDERNLMFQLHIIRRTEIHIQLFFTLMLLLSECMQAMIDNYKTETNRWCGLENASTFVSVSQERMGHKSSLSVLHHMYEPP